MLEKISAPGYEVLSQPDKAVLRCLKAALTESKDPVIYEIGVGVGATTLPVAELLNNRGKIVLFSHQQDVDELAADLNKRGYGNIDAAWGSPNKVYSGYHFELARGFVERRLPEFDLAYIDGGHVFHLDAPAACILKELCKPGGYMIFDDWHWSIAKSPSMRPEIRPQTVDEYDDKQIEACHVQLVCKAFMDTDARFEFLDLDAGTAIYRRRPLS